MLGFYYKIDSGSVLVNYNWLRSAPFFVRAFSFVFPTERESNLGFYRTRPVGLGLGLGGRSRSLYIASGIGPLFLSERFLSLTVRAQRSAGRRPLRPGSLRSCSAGSLIQFPARVPLGLDHLVFGRFTYRPSAPSSCLISLRPSSLGSAGSLIGLRPRSLGVRPVHSSAFGPFQLPSDRPSSLGRFT